MGGDIRLLIDGFMAAEKTLSSAVASWVPDRAGEILRFVRTVEINGEQPGIQLEVKAYPREEALKFRILLVAEKCFWRLDFADDQQVNPLGAPHSAAILIGGPHFHAWEDNRVFATAKNLPKRLQNARILPANIRTFNAAFWWFVDQTNIVISSPDVPDLPRRETLL